MSKQQTVTADKRFPDVEFLNPITNKIQLGAACQKCGELSDGECLCRSRHSEHRLRLMENGL